MGRPSISAINCSRQSGVRLSSISQPQSSLGLRQLYEVARPSVAIDSNRQE